MPLLSQALDKEINLSLATMDGSTLKTPSTPSLDSATSIFSPKTTKSKVNGKAGKADATNTETALPVSLNAGLDISKWESSRELWLWDAIIC